MAPRELLAERSGNEECRNKPWSRRYAGFLILSIALGQVFALGCKRAKRGGAEAAGSVTTPDAPDSMRLRVLFEDCAFAGWSIIEGGTFLHLIVPDAIPVNAGQRVLAIRVPADGRVDLAASAPGARVYGEWPGSAHLQRLTDARADSYEFSRWNGTAWAKDATIAPSVMSLAPWRDRTVLRVQRHAPHGLRLSVQNPKPESAQLRVPPELDRFDAAEIFALPTAGIAVMTGALDDQAGYTIVAGTATAVLRNSMGSSVVTVSPSCERILLSQWVGATAEDPEPRPRAVRIREGRVDLGEDLPAEPAHFAIDGRCHEWLVSAEGNLFEYESPSAGWHRIGLALEGKQPQSSALAALGDRVWVAVGKNLYCVRAGKSETVDLPISLGPNGASFFLAADEQANRLWAAVIPVNEQRGAILTTGPAPQKMRCDELANQIGPK